MVDEMPRPISAAFLAKSERRGWASPFAAAFCWSVSSERRWAPFLLAFCLRWAVARTDLNSEVLSWMDVAAMTSAYASMRE